MNTLRLSLLVAAALCISTISATKARYPLAMWSQKAFADVKETHEPQHMQLVLEAFKSAAATSQAANVVVITKEGLTSRHLARNAKNYDFIKSQLKTHAELYTNLEEPFNATTFKESYETVLSYSLESVVEVETLAKQLEEDLNSSKGQQNVVVIVV
jgi:pyruvate kinase